MTKTFEDATRYGVEAGAFGWGSRRHRQSGHDGRCTVHDLVRKRRIRQYRPEGWGGRQGEENDGVAAGGGHDVVSLAMVGGVLFLVGGGVVRVAVVRGSVLGSVLVVVSRPALVFFSGSCSSHNSTTAIASLLCSFRPFGLV